jgi:endonuclease/exonuclease/phosphatase (EEP) superfamily protein YafD
MLSSQHPFSRMAAWLTLVAAAVALAVVAAAFLAASPKLAAWADLLSPITGHYLIGALGALLALQFSRHAWPVLTMALATALLVHVAMFHWHQVAEPWPAPAAAHANALRVYSHNVWDKHPDLQQLEIALRAVEADVLILIEVDPTKQPLLQRLSARYPYSVSCADNPKCANAILSRFPIVAGGADRIGHEIPPIAWARIDASPRGLGIVTVIGTHIHRPTRSPLLHARQMQSLIGLTKSVQGPIIVAGDFNTSPWSASYRTLLSDTGLTAAGPVVPTWPMVPVALPQFAIDHILLSSGLVATRSGAAPATGSDHAPIFADIEMRPLPLALKHANAAELNAAP